MSFSVPENLEMSQKVSGEEVTLLRLMLDDAWEPRHFTKLYNTDKAKIYRTRY